MAAWLQSLNDASIPFLLWLQSWRNGPLDVFMNLMSWLGREYFYLLLFPFLYWCVRKRWGIWAGLGLILATYTGEYIKWLFKLPRPGAPVQQLWHETSPGFVSTHAAPAVSVWGTLAWHVRRRWFTVLAIAVAFFIGLSRLYLGVHFPADVIGGWLLGLLILGLVLNWLPSLSQTLARWPLWQQIAGVLVLGLFMMIIFPSNWEGNRPAEAGALNAGVLAGFLWGLIWDNHSLHFEVSGPWSKRLLRFVVGLVLVAAAYVGLDMLFDPLSQNNYLLAQSLRFVRYASVGFIVPGLGPWLFMKLRLV